jgi:cyclopropane-fatty-acyl-phospholipid synthase
MDSAPESLPPRNQDPAIERVVRVLDKVFGEPADRGFDITLWDGTRHAGRAPRRGDFSLRVNRRGALRRMLLPPSELSITESFINGDVDIEGNLESAMSLGDSIAGRLGSASAVAALVPHLLALPIDDEAPGDLRRHSRALRLLTPTARKSAAPEIQFHYDVGNDFYALWLDRRMMYTCAYFRREGDSLETAQLAKIEHVCRKLRLRPGEKLLDVGCGWGGLIIHAAKHYGVEALGITLSAAQAELARERIAREGLSDRCKVELLDYRDLPETRKFDKIVSVGMMEHVTETDQPQYFEIAYRALNPGGLFLNHFIVSNVTARRKDGLRERVSGWLWRRDAFIDKYVFPDGRLVALGNPILKGEHAGFETRDVESLREHYALTLRCWLRGLEANKDKAIALVGDKTYRVWRLYMSAAANSFSTGAINVVQTLLSRTGPGGRSGLPLTRDDIYAPSSTTAEHYKTDS